METKRSLSSYELANLYKRAHNLMRNIDGLQPQEAFNELLKFLFFKQTHDFKQQTIALSNVASPTGYFTTRTERAAQIIRSLFFQYVETANSWLKQLWREEHFNLSDPALVALYELFQDVNFVEIDIDIRSTALREFLTPEMRRGLGIYLTPEDVVRLILDVINPTPNLKLYDPACGSGTFLVETVKRWWLDKGLVYHIWGSDKNPKMLLLAKLNLAYFSSISFHHKTLDVFKDSQDDWPTPNSFDIIVTNPPFGITLRHEHLDLSRFITCQLPSKTREKQASEILFIEQALRLLKPGGILGIVLPKSIVTNARLREERFALGKLGYVYAVVTLPPETFQSMGTQVSTVILFMRKYMENENPDEKIKIVAAEVTNVGFDATGRERDGNQLPIVGKEINRMLKDKAYTSNLCRRLPEVSKRESLLYLREILFLPPRKKCKATIKLGDLVKFAKVGKTIPRRNYADKGLFILKVGNLTGHGINWQPRERNFVGEEEAKKRFASPDLLLERGDIVLTASAHSPSYIAKKVDVISTIPMYLGGRATYSGEIMVIRPNDTINPYLLLAYLRSQKARQDIQRMIRGQTAHLYPDDVLDLDIPIALVEQPQRWDDLIQILQKESLLSDELNLLIARQKELIKKHFSGRTS